MDMYIHACASFQARTPCHVPCVTAPLSPPTLYLWPQQGAVPPQQGYAAVGASGRPPYGVPGLYAHPSHAHQVHRARTGPTPGIMAPQGHGTPHGDPRAHAGGPPRDMAGAVASCRAMQLDVSAAALCCDEIPVFRAVSCQHVLWMLTRSLLTQRGSYVVSRLSWLAKQRALVWMSRSLVLARCLDHVNSMLHDYCRC
jgi:hypothetical protein